MTADNLKNTGGTYRITDTATQRFYVGSAANFAKRWRHHVYRLTQGTHPNPTMQNVWNEDPERLVFSIVEELPIAARTRKQLFAAEQVLLDEAEVGVNRQCMNILPVAGSHKGAKRSAETRARLSACKTGLRHSEESKEKMRQAKVGKPLSAEHRRKIGNSVRGKPGPKHTPQQLEKWRGLAPEQVASVFELHRAGFGTPRIAKEVGASRATVRRILAGESYKEVYRAT